MAPDEKSEFRVEIHPQELTSCEIGSDGDEISLGFVDSRGNATKIKLTLNQVGALAMTLPGLLDKAIQTRFGDRNLRYAYPLDSWTIEQSSNPPQGMMTLRTLDGLASVSQFHGTSRANSAKRLRHRPGTRTLTRARTLSRQTRSA